MGLAMAQIAGRRTNQLGNLVRVLELRAIDLYDRSSISKKDLGGSFHNARLSRTGWSEEQQVAYRAAGRLQSGTKHLKHVNQRLHTLFLPYDLCSQGRLKITRVIAADGRIQLMADGSFHFINPSSRLAPQTRGVSHFRATRKHCMGNANLVCSLDIRKIMQTQQHTGFAVLETFSSRETVFHLRKKGKM